jgi:hypothetical protein
MFRTHGVLGYSMPNKRSAHDRSYQCFNKSCAFRYMAVVSVFRISFSFDLQRLEIVLCYLIFMILYLETNIRHDKYCVILNILLRIRIYNS